MKKVDFNYPGTGGFRLTTDLGSILAGRDRLDELAGVGKRLARPGRDNERVRASGAAVDSAGDSCRATFDGQAVVAALHIDGEIITDGRDGAAVDDRVVAVATLDGGSRRGQSCTADRSAGVVGD